MLIKEYRIPLPLTVDEYRIAQLYMIQKKSREESYGAGSGVEILVNEPYQNGPGGSGQYTYKIYHIGSHLPGWFRSILPKSALRVEEEAWNAYPYTKTRYKCPFVEKFSLEIETRYQNDGGEQENIFDLEESDKRNRTIDFIDIVTDAVPSSEYKKEEDPTLYQSEKTNRGPLTETWREEYSNYCRNGPTAIHAIMTAYKLCKVEFRYWGMQTKIERFIHDIGLRKTMLRAHRQAWCWQDEYYGLSLEDIRHLERETQAALAEKMANANDNVEPIDSKKLTMPKTSTTDIPLTASHSSDAIHSCLSKTSPYASIPDHLSNTDTLTSTHSFGSKKSVADQENQSTDSTHEIQRDSNRNLSDWRLESLEQLQESSSDDDEFYDALEQWDSLSLNRERPYLTCTLAESWDSLAQGRHRPHLMHSTSMELITSADEMNKDLRLKGTSFERKIQEYTIRSPDPLLNTPVNSNLKKCSDVLFIVMYGGCLLEAGQEFPTIRADYATLKNTFDSVIKAHYPNIKNHVSFRLLSCPPICAESLNLLSGLSPYSSESTTGKDGEVNPTMTQEFIPLGAIALFASSNIDFEESVTSVITKANHVYQEFLQSDEGKGFTGQVCLIADSTSSLLAYDALCRTSVKEQRNSCRYGSHASIYDGTDGIDGRHSQTYSEYQGSPDSTSYPHDNGTPSPISNDVFTHDIDTAAAASGVSGKPCQQNTSGSRTFSQHLSVQGTQMSSSSSSHTTQRTSSSSHCEANQNAIRLGFEVSEFFMFGAPLGLVLAYRRNVPPVRPTCNQLYNLFHSHDPSAVRLEPLIHDNFKFISPIKIPRHSKFPLGLAEPVHVVTNRWWGNKRLDYALYCPEILHSFPTSALPQLFHSSFWESGDVVSFILRQVFSQDVLNGSETDVEIGAMKKFSPSKPCEKWLKRRTTIKVRNLQPNHRANDVLVLEDVEQVLTAKFSYGPLDMISLSGEKVDIYVMTVPPSGDWDHLGHELTDNHGRLTYTIPKEKRITQGIYPIKMIVRGDHSIVDFHLAVLPPKTEAVVFSIDGSFTASMSIMGKDPKVRAGAVDVVRYWQNLGYLILYVTARPDMQHRKVVSWLAQHNFPHGMVGFMDGLSKDPLRQKLNFLKTYKDDTQLLFKAAYGSAKDIGIYKDLEISQQQIFIVGKASKKHYSQAQILSEGYASHLSNLMKPGMSRPAVGNARLFIRKTCFSLPSQPVRKKSAKRSASCPHGSTASFAAPTGRGSVDLTTYGSQPKLRTPAARSKMPMCLYQEDI
ncbi:protein retinal degeneration B-like isoform X1 [Octopus vulgaris]|uniref:Protein retinal degeneration B-like isoform X1 n=2 Tax=Octopus TaxID=6643 RepID=A0AA36BWU4_OCTVU|nr:protein retinal degeneration B isoform X3 [Octopus sinensis]CAI9741236.1 protein retinal degeneration B-like isoform X1 [Octopus vulgaris]